MRLNSMLVLASVGIGATAIAYAGEKGAASNVAPVVPMQMQVEKEVRQGAVKNIETIEESKKDFLQAADVVPASPMQTEIEKEITMRFEHLDKDQDGSITRKEGKAEPAVADKWDELDMNRDGELTHQEFAKGADG